MSIFSVGGGNAAADYDIEQSLRFEDGDSAKLTWTPGSAGSLKKFTISAWVKRGNLSDGRMISAGTYSEISWSSNSLYIGVGPTNSTQAALMTSAVYRDPSAWYHIVVAADTTQASASNRLKLYVNGEEVTEFSLDQRSLISQDVALSFTGAYEHRIGVDESSGYYDGYIAEVNFIDGQALTSASFGETDSDTNQWKPIEIKSGDLTYGTNGFYLPFSSTELANSFTDSTKYTVESFTSTGTTSWTAPTGVTSVEYLVVAGGGAGGGGVYGGGGGAGGMKTGTHSVTPGQSYTVTVGAGGTATSSGSTSGGDGGDSVFDSITSTGGGGGGGSGIAGRDGGSGGGGGGQTGNPAGGSASPAGQGNPGGAGISLRSGGGGGGAGAAGSAGGNSGRQGGVGGDGLQSNITGTNTYYAGGGGGGSYNQPGGQGGQGGGGTGDFLNPAGSGTANTGGGGGGASTSGGTTGAGGSGIVIIRYLSTSGTLSRHTITANGDVANTRGTNLGSTYKKVDAFTSTGSQTWTCPSGVSSVEVLVVGGGGSGGTHYYGGGGGAGGVVHAASYPVTAGTVYDLTVGAGGAARTSSSKGADGSDSVFNVNGEGSNTTVLTAKGGGGGGYSGSGSDLNGNAGGSGGGGANGSGSTGGATNQPTSFGSPQIATGYGNAGGTSVDDNASGGGGAGAAGSAGSHPNGGPGGIGRQFTTFTAYGTDASNSTAPSTGKGYFGGGGGGCAGGHTAPTLATGGAGGGGQGSRYNPQSPSSVAGDGLTGTGGGGGGAYGPTIPSGGNGVTSGAGGSGGVYIAYDQSKPGQSSIEFDGTGDYLTPSSSSDWAFGTGDFTVEAWIRQDSSPGTYEGIFGTRGSVSDTAGFVFGIKSDGAIYCYSNGMIPTSSTGVISANTWHHVALVRDSGTFEIFVDGTSVATDSTSRTFTSTSARIGATAYDGSEDFVGYMDEIRISNSARYTSNFTPSTTAFTADANTKLLIHSDFNGGLGADNSGNKNDFSATNLVVTDQVPDSPSNNFCTLNPLWMSQSNDSDRTFAEGNLKAATGASSWKNVVTTQNISSGKWYWECVPFGGNFNWEVGVCRTDWKASTANIGPESTGSYCVYCSGSGTGGYFVNGSLTLNNNYVWAANDILMVAYDDATGYFWLGKNGTWFNSGDPAGGSGYIFTVVAGDRGDIYPIFAYHTNTAGYYINTGADSSFSGQKTAQGNQDGNGIGDFYYTPPTGYLALCTDNLDTPSIADPTAHFNTVTYSGNASTRSITGVGFQPDFIWGKSRNQTNAHALVDSVRGNTKYLSSQRTNAEDTQTDVVTSFDSDGFSLGASVGFDMNQSGSNLVAWNWKAGGTASSNTDGTITSSVSANTTAGFSIVKWLGTGSGTPTVGHGLSVVPNLIITKQIDGTSPENWATYSTPTGPDGYINLDQTNAWSSNAGFFNDAPTASVFTPGSHVYVNPSANMIAYCFHSVEGYSRVGSYTGNGSSDGTFIYTGFRPAFVMTKSSSSTGNWTMLDSAREPTNVASPGRLYADLSNNESDGATYDFVSNGFKCRETGGPNNSGVTYIYLAFAESPFKTANAR